MGFLNVFKHGLPIGRLITKSTDLDETAKAQVAATVDVAMGRVLENLITVLDEVLQGLKRAASDEKENM